MRVIRLSYTVKGSLVVSDSSYPKDWTMEEILQYERVNAVETSHDVVEMLLEGDDLTVSVDAERVEDA